MKASRRNPADILIVALLGVGALSFGLLSANRFDLVLDPLGSLLVLSRVVSSAAALGILSLWAGRRDPQPKLEYVRVRR